MFDGHTECLEQVDHRLLLDQSTAFGFVHSLVCNGRGGYMLILARTYQLYAPLVIHTWNMKPDSPRHIPRRQYVLRPELPTFVIPLERSCCAV